MAPVTALHEPDLARTPCIYEGQSIRLTLSIGLYVDIPTSETSSDELLDRADQALYRAKKAGRRIRSKPLPPIWWTAPPAGRSIR